MEIVAVTLLAVAFASINLFHVLYHLLKIPAGTVYVGISHWYQDYFFYLSQLTQGAMGKWSLVNSYTTEKIPQGVSWWFNLWLGKLTYILPIPVWTLYDTTIFVLSVVYIFLMYYVLRKIFPTNPWLRLGSLTIALTSSNLFTIVDGKIELITYFYAYTSSLNRLGGIAHHVAQNILSLIFIFITSKILSEWKDMRSLIRLAISGTTILTLLFIISAFYVAVDLFVFGLVAIFHILIYRKKREVPRLALAFLILALPLVPFAYYQAQALRDPFWVFVRDWEANTPPTNITTFLLSTGLIIPFICFGIGPYLRKLTPLRLLGFVFAFVPMLLYFSPIPKLLHTPSFRVLQPPAYVFLGAIAANGMEVLSTLFKRFKKFVFITLLALFVAIQIPAIATEVKLRTDEPYLSSSLNFVPKGIYEGLMYLRALPHNTNVLAFHTLETLVPVISGHTVYTGHGTLTINIYQKNTNAFNFYTGKMPASEALTLLRDNDIGFVLWKTEDGESRIFTSVYPFLKQIYKNPLIEIYAVE